MSEFKGLNIKRKANTVFIRFDMDSEDKAISMEKEIEILVLTGQKISFTEVSPDNWCVEKYKYFDGIIN